MPKKSKRRPAGKRPRPAFPPPPAPASSALQGSSATATAPSPAPPARPAGGTRIGGNESLVRSVEMSLAPRGVGAGRKAQRGALALDGVDPAIPLDRVPYFLSDLRKLALVAAVMLALLVVGAELIPRLVH